MIRSGVVRHRRPVLNGWAAQREYTADNRKGESWQGWQDTPSVGAASLGMSDAAKPGGLST